MGRALLAKTGANADARGGEERQAVGNGPDRRVLCTQTSARLLKYRIDHGVLMAGSGDVSQIKVRSNLHCSDTRKREALTGCGFADHRRGAPVRARKVEFIRNNPQVKVIGCQVRHLLSGHGRRSIRASNQVTIDQLVEQGWLIRPRVFIAQEIDMAGARKVAGEWSAAETKKRGIPDHRGYRDGVRIFKRTRYWRPDKTIVFVGRGAWRGLWCASSASSATTLCRSATSDDDDYKSDVLAEFDKRTPIFTVSWRPTSRPRV